MLKRILQIVLGLAIGISLFGVYSDETHEKKLIIWYLLTPKVLQVIAWIVLFYLASHLVSGKPNDYSKFFYNMLVKIFRDPKEVDKRY